MTEYRKKPVVINAWQFRPGAPVPAFIADAMDSGAVEYHGGDCPYINIPTLEGVMRGDSGDFIIRGVKGEFYPCKPDIFAMTYELAE